MAVISRSYTPNISLKNQLPEMVIILLHKVGIKGQLDVAVKF